MIALVILLIAGVAIGMADSDSTLAQVAAGVATVIVISEVLHVLFNL